MGRHEPDPNTVLRTGIERLVLELLRASGGATTVEPIPGLSSISRTVPTDWAAGILAARKVAEAARGQVRDYAGRARGAGLAWAALADPLGIPADDITVDRAAAAFDLIAGAPSFRFDPVTTAWRCASCEKYVTDTGPYGHPVDCERGHAEDCPRHRREIAAYEARWADDDG